MINVLLPSVYQGVFYHCLPPVMSNKSKTKGQDNMGVAEEEAFEFIRKCLTSEPIPAYPDFSKEFLIYKDAVLVRSYPRCTIGRTNPSLTPATTLTKPKLTTLPLRRRLQWRSWGKNVSATIFKTNLSSSSVTTGRFSGCKR